MAVMPPSLPEGWRDTFVALADQVTHATRLDLEQLIATLTPDRTQRPLVRMLTAAHKGQSFAEPGERETSLFHLLRALAAAWPHASVASIQALLSPALAMMQEPPPGPSLDDVHEKWSRLAREAAEGQASRVDDRAAARRRAWSWVGLQSETELALAPATPVVYQTGKTYYVQVGPEVAGPWSKADIDIPMYRDLCALYGRKTPKTLHAANKAMLCRVAKIEKSFWATRTEYDLATNTLNVALAPLRNVGGPEYSPHAAEFIDRLAGPYTVHLQCWLGLLLRTEQPLRALFLSGSKGLGKSLFLAGVGQLWQDGPAMMRDVIGKRFNAGALRCPLSISDDDMHPAEDGGAVVAYLREAVDARNQRIEEKFHEVTTVGGCLRFAVATNDPLQMIQGATPHRMNGDALEAFGDRVLHIPIRTNAYQGLGVTPTQLVKGHILARHILWLTERYRGVTEWPDRYAVPEADPDLARYAVISSGLRGDVLCYLAKMIDTGRPGPGVELGQHAVVRTQQLFDGWVMDRPKCSVRTLGMAVKALAAASAQGGTYRDETGKAVHTVDVEMVRWYARTVGL